MAIPTEHAHRKAYHFTSIENLQLILKHGLLSYNEKKKRGIKHVDVAEESIQMRRSSMAIPCGPGGVVHDYVPFYFCKRTSMLQSVIQRKNIDQQFLIYLALPIEWVDSGIAVFSDASANTDIPPNFYASSADLHHLHWDLIDSSTWKWTETQKQSRMAELLVHKEVPVKAFGGIITWNKSLSECVGEIYAEAGFTPPAIWEDTHFYYTKYPAATNLSLVTGPHFLKKGFETTVKAVLENRANSASKKPAFANVEDAVRLIDGNFGALPELKGIANLDTANPEHHENVGQHTQTVVAKLRGLKECESLAAREKTITILAAYLHDIGKATSQRDKVGRQKVDSDHPANAIPLMQRILSEEFVDLSKKDVRQLMLLVTYHDLIGDVICRKRDRTQVVDVIKTENDFDMLVALCLADVSSLVPAGGFAAMVSPHTRWLNDIKAGLPDLRQWVLANLKKAD